ncbi:DHH family phosphoesterase [Longirhabdus pacifica]|uniref:DHH family phosphoesterase n=1 Tax=Longirhabdus pacifica TaxID=2305227 RepID=UPI00100888E9|nr:bifunctional oligoribonuclease/PAP phosphatase NrnA [Longirhabdus pacifica]
MTLHSSFKEAAQFMTDHHHFLVISHVNPDGDAVSSTCAISYMLQAMNKTYQLVNQDVIPNKLSVIPNADQVKVWNEDFMTLQPFDAVIAVDCADQMRMGSCHEQIIGKLPVLNIDHHPTNDAYGTVNIICPSAASTTEIIYDLMDVISLEWNLPLATCIYIGLLTDTGGFRYANTTAKVMQIASHLISLGIDAHYFAQALLEQMTFSQIQLLKHALTTLTFDDDGSLGWITITKSDLSLVNASFSDSEGLVNLPRNVEGVEVAVLFKQYGDDEIKISLRSNGKADVAEIASYFGGGGHKNAAGATLHTSLEKATLTVLEKCRQVIQK